MGARSWCPGAWLLFLFSRISNDAADVESVMLVPVPPPSPQTRKSAIAHRAAVWLESWLPVLNCSSPAAL